MAITKGQIASGGSVIFGRNSIDNIVESTENPNTYVTSGGKLLANYMDLQSDISSASTDSEKAKAPTTSAVQSYISDISASVSDVLTGTNDTNVIDVNALRGTLTAGQAVDVTSVPDQTITGDYKGTFTTTSTTLGFASFPKFAPNLKYLMIADITVASARNITPSGTWLDGTASSKALVENTPTRVAMLFNAVNKGKFTFSGSGTVTVSNLREYEVTACTAESIAYIASLNNPDAFSDYYLVKQDMIQPWTYIIDMGTSPAVTIASGLSYKLNASTGTHQLTVDTCPVGYDGRDAIIRIRLGGNGVIQTVEHLQLGGALVPYAINNCVVRFRDGEAVLLVEDTLAGYVVSVNSGTDNGSLPYGLAKTGVPYIAFSPNTNGTPVQISGATTAPEEVTVVGNGYDETILTGEITCTSKTTVANLALSDVQVVGGTMTLGDTYIPSGSTVAVSGGGLAVEKVTGDGGVIDLGGTNYEMSSGTSAIVSGVTVANGSASQYGGAFKANASCVLVLKDAVLVGNTAHITGGCLFTTGNPLVELTNCILSGNGLAVGNKPQYAGAFNVASQAHIIVSGSTITGNRAIYGGGGMIVNGLLELTDSIVSGNSLTGGGNIGRDIAIEGGILSLLGGNTIGSATLRSNGVATLAGSNNVTVLAGRNSSDYGSVTISSGAVLDLTGNTNATPIAPGGGITFESGGATIYPSAGSVSAATVGVTGGTFTAASISNTATLTVDKGVSNITAMTLRNCSIVSTASALYWSFSTNSEDTRIMTFENCTFDCPNNSTFAIGVTTGTINIKNCTFLHSARPWDQSAKSVTLNMAGNIYSHGIQGDIAFSTKVVNIADGTYLDASNCESIYLMRGTITFGSGVKIKKYGTTEYVDLVEGGTSGTCYIIKRDGSISYSA